MPLETMLGSNRARPASDLDGGPDPALKRNGTREPTAPA
jgi:hypothetical protein